MVLTQLKNAGGLAGIGMNIGDYTPPYLYILALLTYLPVEALFSIKLVSCIFDFLLALYAAKTVFHLTQSRAKTLLAYTLALLCPTVVLNGSAWAQCDSIFTFFLLLSFYSALKSRPWRVCIFFGIAFAFKLQAIFFAPLLLLLCIKNRLWLRHLLTIPAVYLLSILPAWIAGRNFWDLLTIYFNQAGQYHNLSKNAPNVWSFLGLQTGQRPESVRHHAGRRGSDLPAVFFMGKMPNTFRRHAFDGGARLFAGDSLFSPAYA